MSLEAAQGRGPTCDLQHPAGAAWRGDDPVLHCELGRCSGTHQRRDGLTRRYAYACPSRTLLEKLADLSPTIEVGAGSGYWARLLQDLGAEVVPIDNRSWSVQWDTTWTDVLDADAAFASDLPDHTLLTVMPPRPGSERLWETATGDRMVVVTSGPYPNPASMPDREPRDLLARRGWSLTASEPLWDPIDRDMAAYFFARKMRA